MSPRREPRASGRRVSPMRRAARPAGPGNTPAGVELADVAAAAACLRRESARRGRLRAGGAVLAGLVIAGTAWIGYVVVRGGPPPVWVALALGAATWLGLAVHGRRLTASDAAEADRLRAATVLRAGSGNAVVVRDTNGSTWRWRHRATGRALIPGERAWLGGRGPLVEAPHLVMTLPVRADRYVVWAAADRTVARLPDPAGDHDTGPLPTVFVDEQDS